MYIKKVLLVILLLCGSGYSQVAIIANKSVKLDKIEQAELLDYYSRELKFWDNGDPIIIFDLKVKNEIRDIFYKYLGKSSSRMKSIWMKKMLLGEGDPPEPLDSEEDMLEKIIETPGSIGFINAELVTDEVKLLRIINDED
jgi:ABC-type phosphate transport system substrate-binding protein